MSRVQKALLASLFLALAVMWWLLSTKVFFPSAPMAFIESGIMTPVVRPGEHLSMYAVMDVRASSECFQGTQRFLRFSDGSEARVPGTRRSSGNGRQIVIHDLVLPPSAPVGRATFAVRETFVCGLDPVDGPGLAFEVRR